LLTLFFLNVCLLGLDHICCFIEGVAGAVHYSVSAGYLLTGEFNFLKPVVDSLPADLSD
jgi:hypothetical protein